MDSLSRRAGGESHGDRVAFGELIGAGNDLTTHGLPHNGEAAIEGGLRRKRHQFGATSAGRNVLVSQSH